MSTTAKAADTGAAGCQAERQTGHLLGSLVRRL